MNTTQTKTYIKTFLGILHGERAIGGPIRADLGLTSRCNIRCLHCFYYSPVLEKALMPQLRLSRNLSEPAPDGDVLNTLQHIDIDMDRMLAVVNELLGMGTRRFQITGNGEPLLHPRALELFGFLKNNGAFCLVKTNGLKIDRSTADTMIEIGVDRVKITTMAGTSDMYVQTHPGVHPAVFDTLKDTLMYFDEQKKLLKRKHPRITLSCIVIKQNISGLLQFAQFACQAHVNEVYIKPLDDVVDPNLAKLIPDENSLQEYQEQMEKIKTCLQSAGIAFRTAPYVEHYFGRFDTTKLYRKIACYYGWLSTRIFSDGEVYPCCRGNMSLGNINESSFMEIWNGERYRRFRKEAQAMPKSETMVTGCDCQHCIHYMANIRQHRLRYPWTRRSLVNDKIGGLILRDGALE